MAQNTPGHPQSNVGGNRKDTAFAQAREATHAVDTPDKIAQDAISSGQPVENMDWRPPETLETPPAPAGWHYTWVRTSVAGIDDADNIRKMLNQGWRPVPASEAPKGYFPPTISDERFAGGIAVIGVRDMILCKIPMKMKRQRDAYYQKEGETQVQEIDKRLRSESQRPGDRFMIDRQSSTELRSVPLDDDNADN